MTLKFDGWPWQTTQHHFYATLTLCVNLKPSVNSNLSYGPEMGFVLIFVTLSFDLWLWPLAWTSLLSMVITPENFMIIWWQEHREKGVTDRRTDGQTDRRMERTVHRAVWLQLKNIPCSWYPGKIPTGGKREEAIRPVSQIPECIEQTFHNALFCNRNVHTSAHFFHKMVHCGICDWCIVGFVQYVST